MLSYLNQATQVILVDIPSLASIKHFPGIGKIASCLRDIVSLAVLSTSHLVPSMSLILSLHENIQTLLPITPINSSTVKAITASLLKMDEVLNKMEEKECGNNITLPAAFSRVLELARNNDMEVQLHIFTSRPLEHVENILSEVLNSEKMPNGLRPIKVLSPSMVLERGEQQITMDLERVTFSDWLDLNIYFREWLVHQSSEKSDLKVEISQKGIREVLQMDLRARTVELGDKMSNRVMEQGGDRLTVLSTVSQDGVCQSLVMGDILLGLPTSASMLGWRELEDNRTKIITIHTELSRTRKSLILGSANKLYFLAPVLSTRSTFLLGNLATAEVLLPLPSHDVAIMGSQEREDKTVVEMITQLEHHSVYNPLEYNTGKLESAWERLVHSRQGPGDKVIRGRGSRGRGEGGRGRGRGRGNTGKCPIVTIV